MSSYACSSEASGDYSINCRSGKVAHLSQFGEMGFFYFE